MYSNKSFGWHLSSRQRASNVENLIALALPVFNIERFAGVISIRSANSESDIFRFAIITSTFTIILPKSTSFLNSQILFFLNIRTYLK